jgi:inward rectifier potassium channel
MGEYELIKIGAQRFDPKDPYHFALTIGWPAFALYVFATYGLITLLFALLYLANPGSIANARPGSLEDTFFFSIETLATVGYGEMAPATLVGHLIAAGEIIAGMAFTAIMTGLIFVRFSKPRPKILFSEKMVIALHNGAPTLMVRIGNGRMNMLTDTTVQLNALIREVSHEGRDAYNVHELKLFRDKVPVFPLTLTLMHRIDKSSPLFDLDFSNPIDGRIRLFVTIQARDPALAAVVHDLKTYAAADVAPGMRFIDAVTINEAGLSVADLTKISLIEPDVVARPVTAVAAASAE